MKHRRRKRQRMWAEPVTVSMKPDELETLDRLADDRDMTRSELVRHWIRNAVAGEKEVEVIQKPTDPVVVPKG